MGISITGTANSYADLLTALNTACTDNGYTLTGNVLSKGTFFLEAKVVGSTLQIQGGTGQTGGVLTGRSNMQPSLIGITVVNKVPPNSSGVNTPHPVVFPVTYDIHINTAPDEVYLFINYEINLYQYLAFGQSDMPGLGGTGNWYYGSAGINTSGSSWDMRIIGGGGATGGYFNPGLFDALQGYGAGVGGIDHSMDAANQWGPYWSYPDRWQTQGNSPNAWNGESVLAPIIVYTSRASDLRSPVLQTGHSRWVMIDNLTDGQIITLGSDKWKIYPLWKRGERLMNNVNNSNNSGTATYGHAIRYNGA